MNEPAHTIHDEPRWPLALAILVVLGLLAVCPHHVRVLPVWVFHTAALAMLGAMGTHKRERAIGPHLLYLIV